MMMFKKIFCSLSFLLPALLSAGCAFSAYSNEPLPDPPPVPTRATFNVQNTAGNPDVLVALAISGGGSRSAYFASSAMFRLQEVFDSVDLLEEVDVISCVSGGSIAGAYYCISQDWAGKEMRSNRPWQKSELKEILSRNFQARWVGNALLPFNVFRSWFTAYDRSDVMAKTLEDNLFDTLPMGYPLTFADLNPDRPYLIINATNATKDCDGEEFFGKIFTFTEEHFREKIRSDLSKYAIARAVMASCTFPGVFNYHTVRDYRAPEGERRYMHLFDGGNSDNLGLESIKRVILESIWRGKAKKFVVILLDSYISGQGAEGTDDDPRSFMNPTVDMNLINAFESLMKFRREDLLGQYHTGIFTIDQGRKEKIENLTFWHIHFNAVDTQAKDHEGDCLREKLNCIPTNFNLSEEDMRRIDRAVDLLIHPDEPTLNKIIGVLYS